MTERKHRHIVEMGLAMLAQSGVPILFWDAAFESACFIINLLPMRSHSFTSPYECLFHTKPNYSSLHVFGCLCFPCLRPYINHKLQFRSSLCVFLGYPPRYQGYRCYSPATGRMYILGDVIFDEDIFSYRTKNLTGVATQLREVSHFKQPTTAPLFSYINPAPTPLTISFDMPDSTITSTSTTQIAHNHEGIHPQIQVPYSPLRVNNLLPLLVMAQPQILPCPPKSHYLL